MYKFFHELSITGRMALSKKYDVGRPLYLLSSLLPLFVYFLAFPSLLPFTIFVIVFYTCKIYRVEWFIGDIQQTTIT